MSNIVTCICDGCGLEKKGMDSLPVYYQEFEEDNVSHWSKVHYCDDCVVPEDVVTQLPSSR